MFDTFAVTGFIPTGAGTHGLYVSRDSKVLYVTNRNSGTVSLLDFATNAVTRTWVIPGEEDPRVSTGGFHIWPEGMPDPTEPALSEEADLPVAVS